MCDLQGVRILALASEFPPFRGGIGTYAFSMAQAATELGAELSVLAPDYGKPSKEDQRYPFQVIRFSGGPHSAKDSLTKLRLAWSVICGRGARFDIVHAMDWPFFIPAALSTRTRQRRLLTIHGSDVNDMSTGYKRLAITAAGVFAGRSEVVANSAFTRDLLLSRFPRIRPRSLRYQYLGVAEFWHVPTERSDAARTRLGLPQDKFVLITVGRLTRRKGQLHVLETLKRLPEIVRRNLVYLIVGSEIDHDYVAQVDAAIVGADLEVQRMTSVDNTELRQLYANCDAFCLVGQDVDDGTVEGFGLVYLEAAAQGLPSIAGAMGAVEEVVLDQVTGLVVPSSNPEALAAAVTCLIERPELRANLSTGAHARALDLTWRRCAESTYLIPQSPRHTGSIWPGHRAGIAGC